MDLGRTWHRAAGQLLAGEGWLEVRVRREGISCRIDLMADVPVEIKTGASPPPADIRAERPEHVEQLAMYCALLGQSTGRLVHIAVTNGRTSGVRATDVRFGELGPMVDAMRSRESALLEAIDRGRSDGLPRCRWFGRGCEFQEARTCDCRGDERLGDATLDDQVRSLTERTEIAERWQRLLGSAPEEPPTLGRYRELVYPRRAFFDLRPGAPVEREEPSTSVPRPPDLFDRLLGTVESGPVGEVRQLSARWEVPAEEEVVGFRGAPFLLRTSRAGARIPAAEVVARFPQYALELGFRCAATGTSIGRVIVGYERAEVDADRLHVLELRFNPVAGFARLASERARRLRAALSNGAPGDLDPCPAWMFTTCPYRDECGCGAGASRSQR